MVSFLRSDLFRSLTGGFIMGLTALVTLTPAEGTALLKDKIESVYRS